MYDIIMDSHDRMKISTEEFQLNTFQWEGITKIHCPTDLTWDSLAFRAEEAPNIPLTRGVYAFVVRPGEHPIPPHQYLMYIGISRRTLRARFREYFKEKARMKRPKFYKYLTRYEDYLYFYFAPVKDESFDLRHLERALNDALLPPMNQMDFSADIRQARKAF